MAGGLARRSMLPLGSGGADTRRLAYRQGLHTITARVVANAHDCADHLDGLRRIGINEVSYKKGDESCCFVWGELVGGLTLREPHRSARVAEVGMAGVVQT